MAIQPDAYSGRKTTQDPGPGQSLLDPGHFPWMPPTPLGSPLYTTYIKVSDFSLYIGVSYKRVCNFSQFPITENYVITWRGVKNFNQQPQLVVGEELSPIL